MNLSTAQAADMTACEREPIHVPGSIQPHGMLMLADARDLVVAQVAGDAESFLGVGPDACLGAKASALLSLSAARLTEDVPQQGPVPLYLGTVTPAGRRLDVTAHRRGTLLYIELEDAVDDESTGSDALGLLEQATQRLESAETMEELCDRAARAVARVTGFGRVMVYRFLPDETGSVVAEARAPHMDGFLNHRFPASDIPRQARALYLRNLIRVIPDSGYAPAPLHPEISPLTGGALDMTDCALRSVSPIHLQYLRNMGVAASMSISLVRGGRLWGLIACHHDTPRAVPFRARALCRTLGGLLSQHIAALEDREAYARRAGLRGAGDAVIDLLARIPAVGEALESHPAMLRSAVPSDGFALCWDGRIRTLGRTPGRKTIRKLVAWVCGRNDDITATECLERDAPDAIGPVAAASGLLGCVVSRTAGSVLLWFRAEQVEVINWAGNPHEPHRPGTVPGTLTPRDSFEAWRERVSGRAHPWSSDEIGAAARLRRTVVEAHRTEELENLTHRLERTLAEETRLQAHKDFLLREMDHRVQNSLQMVNSMLSMQGKSATAQERERFEEASRRITAIALVHRHLYRADEMGVVNLGLYVAELMEGFVGTLGPEWKDCIAMEIEDMSASPKEAVYMGLILTELVMNAVKYAYDGGPGPIEIRAETPEPGTWRMAVADRGRGMPQETSVGFGTRLIEALASSLGGTVQRDEASPGTRTLLTLPIGATA